MDEITRYGVTRRWSDAVAYQGIASFVEVADDSTQDTDGQVRQVLTQAEHRLRLIGSDKTRLLQVLIYLADLNDKQILNSLWDKWIPEGHAPTRACVQVVLGPGARVEMVFTAAISDETGM